MKLYSLVREKLAKRKLVRKYKELDLSGDDGFKILDDTLKQDDEFRDLVVRTEGRYGNELYNPAHLVFLDGSWKHNGANIHYDPKSRRVRICEWSEPPYGRGGLDGEEFCDTFPLTYGAIKESSFTAITPEVLRDFVVIYIELSSIIKMKNEARPQVELIL